MAQEEFYWLSRKSGFQKSDHLILMTASIP